jgi:5-methyltetrahydropteroyltriglutamate--homocysteine methyltransferase
MSKPSYATYIKDRLAGFGGEGNTFVYQDLAAFPRLEKKVFGDPGRSRRKTPACNAPIAVRDPDAARIDVTHLKAALASVTAREGFLTGASPGVISLFFRNQHYRTDEEYIHAIAEAMRPEYETIARAGLVLQIDCPDLGMGRHIQYAHLGLPRVAQEGRDARRGAQPGHAQHPARAAAHAPVLGQLRRAAPLRRGARRRHRHRVQGAAERDRARGREPAPRARMEAVRDGEAAEGKTLIPGVIESKSNFIEHPELIAQRIARYAKLVGRENVMAGSDCGFGTWVGQAAVDPDVVWAKMAAMAEGARIASREFWKH